MDDKYRYLEPGEIIREGDEVEISNSWHDPEKWVRAHCIGEPAPSRAVAHRIYRRKLVMDVVDRALDEVYGDDDAE